MALKKGKKWLKMVNFEAFFEKISSRIAVNFEFFKMKKVISKKRGNLLLSSMKMTLKKSKKWGFFDQKLTVLGQISSRIAVNFMFLYF